MERRQPSRRTSLVKLPGFKKRDHDSFKKRAKAKTEPACTELLAAGLPAAPQEQKEPSFRKRKAFALLPVANGPGLKRAKTWSSADVSISGGNAQPQRVIGYMRTKTHIDVEFRVDGDMHSVGAHRHVIEENCKGFRLPDSRVVTLSAPCNHAAFSSLIEFFYSGACTLPEFLIVPFLETASHCKAAAAIEAASKAFAPHVSEANCLEILFCADRLRLPRALVSAAEARVRSDFELVRTRRQFLQISPSLIRSLATDGTIGKTSEESVFEAVVSWISAQTPPPSDDAVRALLQPLRYAAMELDYVRSTVLTHPLILSHPDRHGLLLEAFIAAVHGTTGLSK